MLAFFCRMCYTSIHSTDEMKRKETGDKILEKTQQRHVVEVPSEELSDWKAHCAILRESASTKSPEQLLKRAESCVLTGVSLQAVPGFFTFTFLKMRILHKNKAGNTSCVFGESTDVAQGKKRKQRAMTMPSIVGAGFRTSHRVYHNAPAL